MPWSCASGPSGWWKSRRRSIRRSGRRLHRSRARGCTGETLRKGVRQAERDRGKRGGLTTDERPRFKELERENRGLTRTNELVRTASAYFAQAELARRVKGGSGCIDAHRDVYMGSSWSAPCCRSPRRPPSTYVLHKTPARGSPAAKRRAHRDDALGVEMQRVWDTNHPVYGPRKGWKPRPRDGARVAGCTVRRLMRAMGLAAAGGPG